MKLTKKAAKRFTLGNPVDVPLPGPIIEEVSREELLERYPPVVVTKVDRKRGRITLESVVDVERCGRTATGAPIFAIGKKP